MSNIETVEFTEHIALKHALAEFISAQAGQHCKRWPSTDMEALRRLHALLSTPRPTSIIVLSIGYPA